MKKADPGPSAETRTPETSKTPRIMPMCDENIAAAEAAPGPVIYIDQEKFCPSTTSTTIAMKHTRVAHRLHHRHGSGRPIHGNSLAGKKTHGDAILRHPRRGLPHPKSHHGAKTTGQGHVYRPRPHHRQIQQNTISHMKMPSRPTFSPTVSTWTKGETKIYHYQGKSSLLTTP